MIETPYIVIRGTGDPRFDGWWFDYPLPPAPPAVSIHLLEGLQVNLVPTEVIEQRADGARATVFRPEPQP